MKIAYIGNFEPEFSTENDVRKAFEFLGHELIQLQENKVTPSHVRNIALTSDMLLITSTWDNALDLKEMLTIFKECAEKKIPTVTLHLDTFWGKSRGGRKWWLNPMFYTAFIFTADGDYQDEWLLYGKNHIWLPPAVRHDAVSEGNFREEYACDVAFVGSNGIGYHEDVWPDRKILVDNLREMCRKNNWIFKNPGGDEPKINRSTDMNDFYASAKVTVGDSLCLKKEKSKYWSDRVPEATGRGGFLIMPKIDALSKQGWNIPRYDWGDYEMLETMLKHFINQDSSREEIRKLNFNNTKENHTYVNRAQTILKTVGLDG